MSKSTTSIDMTNLTAADRKHLLRIFGHLPESGTLKVSTPKDRSPKPCACGCGETTKSEFTAGHDAKLKSVLNSVVKGETPKSPNHLGFDKKSALAELARRGW